MTDTMSNYENWFTTVVQFSIATGIAPDEFIWDLEDKSWILNYSEGMYPAEAVRNRWPDKFNQVATFDDNGKMKSLPIVTNNYAMAMGVIRAAFGDDLRMCSVSEVEKVH